MTIKVREKIKDVLCHGHSYRGCSIRNGQPQFSKTTRLQFDSSNRSKSTFIDHSAMVNYSAEQQNNLPFQNLSGLQKHHTPNDKLY